MSLSFLVVAVPVLGAACQTLAPAGSLRAARGCAAAFAALELALCALAALLFDRYDPAVQLATARPWIDTLGIGFRTGFDGVSLWLLLAGALVALCCVLYPRGMEGRPREYYFWLFLLEAAFAGILVSRDMFLLGAFWIAYAVPVYFLEGLREGEQDGAAASGHLIYSVATSALMMAAITALYTLAKARSFSARDIFQAGASLSGEAQCWIFAAFMAAAAARAPLPPFHSWLGGSLRRAPASGAAIFGFGAITGVYLALKAAAVLPGGAFGLSWPLLTLCAASALYCAALAVSAEEMQTAVAWSGAAFSAVLLAGAVSGSVTARAGAVLGACCAGAAAAALLLLGDALRQRFQNPLSARGLLQSMPVFSALFIVCAASLAALPPTGGFAGAYLALAGLFPGYPWHAAAGMAAILAVALLAALACRRLLWGDFDAGLQTPDIRPLEAVAIVPLAVFTLLCGIYPKLLLDYIVPAVTELGRLRN